MIAFWGAVTATSGGSPLDKALYCAMNVVLLFLSVFLGRRVYAVFGVIGIAMLSRRPRRQGVQATRCCFRSRSR